jgi:hypothetical protein
LNIEHSDIYIVDKNGRTIYLNAMNDITYESKFYVFNKTFYKEQLVKIFEENCEKCAHNYNNQNSNIPSAMTSISFDSFSVNNPIFEQNNKLLEKFGLHHTDFRKINEFLADTFDNVKIIFKNLKTNSKISEKIIDNYKFQYNSLECIYKNISMLYE